ncbi:MAG TPA: alpha/beta hydrolase [Thermoanaerobaculia bacterium]|jgi:pimeloyl-ACP methyl ester carboxylesterase
MTPGAADRLATPQLGVAWRGGDGVSLFATVLERSGKGTAPDLPLVLLHGGGPDHQMFLPLARELADLHTVVLPDVRGYGRSICRDPERHTWSQYADDVIALMNHLGVRRAIVGGAGLGSTIALRTAVAYAERIHAVILISVEDIEDDEKKKAEIAFMDAFADRVRNEGIEAAWAPILDDLAPIIGTLVREAIPRSDPGSIAAAAAIGRDRSFRNIDELAGITAPTLIIPGMDERHPAQLAEDLARLLPRGHLAPVRLAAAVKTADDFGRAFAPAVRDFLRTL